jgi:hypothetical protein
VLQPAHEGNQGWLVWGEERISAPTRWQDPVVLYSLLRHRITYVRLLRRNASSPRAKGADRDGFRSSAQLALEGVPYQKPKHPLGEGTVGLYLGPSTIAIVPELGEARLGLFCAALAPRVAKKRRWQRKLDRKLRANNPQHYDEQGRCKQGRKTWYDSQGYTSTRRRLAHQERKLAAQRKSLHGQLAHEIVAVGDTIITEQISYRAWQRQFGRSVGLRAPGMFLAILVSHRGLARAASQGARPHLTYQTVTILPWVWCLRQEAALPALAPMPVRDWPGAAWPVLRVSGGASASPDLPSLSCPGPLGACGDATAEQQERPPSNARMRGRSAPK